MVTQRTLAPALCAAWLCAGCLATTDRGALVPPTAERDAALPQITLNIAGHSRAVHVETYGNPDQPVLLGLHGSLSDLRSMRVLSELSDRYFVVLWDQRGNGRIGSAEYTFDSVVDEIDAMRERYAHGARVTLIGHSFGAMYSALYMSQQPDRVEQAALIEPAGLNGDILTKTYADVIDVDLFSAELSETYWQNELLSAGDHEAMDYKALLLLENSHQTHYFCDPEPPPRFPVWRPGAFVDYVRGIRMGGGLSGANFEYDFARGLDTFPREVLLVGTNCSALGDDYQRRYHAPLFAHAKLVRIENAGHRVFVEQPEALLRALRAYLLQYALAE